MQKVARDSSYCSVVVILLCYESIQCRDLIYKTVGQFHTLALNDSPTTCTGMRMCLYEYAYMP